MTRGPSGARWGNHAKSPGLIGGGSASAARARLGSSMNCAAPAAEAASTHRRLTSALNDPPSLAPREYLPLGDVHRPGRKSQTCLLVRGGCFMRSETPWGGMKTGSRPESRPITKRRWLTPRSSLGCRNGWRTGRWRPTRWRRSCGSRSRICIAACGGSPSIGICEEQADGRFSLTSLGASLRKGAPSRLGEKVEIVVGQYWLPWAELLATLETGRPAFDQVFGMDVDAWRRQNQADGASFNAYLAGETFATAAPIVEALDVSGASTVADIGGGHGGLLAAVCEGAPSAPRRAVRLPETVEGALPFLQSYGVAERVRRVGGDIAKRFPSRPMSIC